MKRKKVSRTELKEQATKQHEAVCNFLNQKEIYSLLEKSLYESTEFLLFEKLCKSTQPVKASVFEKDYIEKNTISVAAERLSRFLSNYSEKFSVLQENVISIIIPRKQGGAQIGYYFACRNNLTDKFVDPVEADGFLKKAFENYLAEKNGTIKKTAIEKDIIDFTDFLNDRTIDFVGRDFVFDEISDFIGCNKNGYLIIKGDPGIGKSSIMAKLVNDKQYIHHFNIASRGINKASTFLKNICAQLIINYQLNYTLLPAEAWEDDIFLNRLFSEALGKTEAGQKIVIVVDALDEVDSKGQSSRANILYLPSRLPENVYVIATVRNQDVNLKLECTHKYYPIEHNSNGNKNDIREHIRMRTGSEGIKRYIKKHKLKLQPFVEQMLEKSEGNFMYLRHVLPEIESGAYQNLDFEELPSGLENYYEDHWRRMNMMDKNFKEKIKIIYVLSEARQQVSVDLLKDFAGKDSIVVQSVLDEWEPFLHKQKVDDYNRYGLYHSSFKDFLNRKEIIQSAGVDIRDINNSIGDSFFNDIDD